MSFLKSLLPQLWSCFGIKTNEGTCSFVLSGMSGMTCMPYSVWSSLPASVCQLTKTFVCELGPQLI